MAAFVSAYSTTTFSSFNTNLISSKSNLSNLLLSYNYIRRPILSSIPTLSTHSTNDSISKSFQSLVSSLEKLANSRGALGRGVRACLIAFYQRATHLLPSSSSSFYIEIGPAYVLASVRTSQIHPTRYAVEQKAWPALQNLLQWQETTSTEARQRGAVLRPLKPGTRFGRHLFISNIALQALLHVAHNYLTLSDISSTSLFHNHFESDQSEAIIRLRRSPLPGARTVAARCPRTHAHANGDRNPSLVLWMNADGRTGGAMCSVCTHKPGEQLTWRVTYLSSNLAELRAPRARRISALIEKELSSRTSEMYISSNHSDTKVETKVRMIASTISNSSKNNTTTAIGGCVLIDREKINKVGQVMNMAYVTASLRIGNTKNTTGQQFDGDSTRLRTVGTMARQQCPMQVLLWSDRRSKGPRSSQRVEEVAWFARHAIGGFDDNDSEDDTTTGNIWQSTNVDSLESEEWLPTPLVSVSAMRPSSWRDVTSARGRLVSVPASWEASVQAWILFDIDDLESLDKHGVVAKAGNKITLAVRRNQELSGRCVVMQTGPCGLHVWAELREPRSTPAEWFRKADTREWYTSLGEKLLSAAHKVGAVGGKIDMSSCSAGRFARRPGWRLLENGSLFRSHVVAYVPSTVRNRKPRYS